MNLLGLNAPWFKFFPSRWLRSEAVAAMTMEERGLFIQLLALQWDNGGTLPVDTELIRALAGVDHETWDRCSLKVLKKFMTEGERRYNHQLIGIWKDQQARSEESKKKAKKRWGDDAAADATAMPQHMPMQCHGNATASVQQSHSNATAMPRQCDVDIEVEVDGEIERSKSKPVVGPTEDGVLDITSIPAELPELLSPDSPVTVLTPIVYEHVFKHYLKALNKEERLYRWSRGRRDKGVARLRDALRITRVKHNLQDALALMRAAVDKLAASDFHMGRDPKHPGVKYDTWEKNLFNSYERFEWWLNK